MTIVVELVSGHSSCSCLNALGCFFVFPLVLCTFILSDCCFLGEAKGQQSDNSRSGRFFVLSDCCDFLSSSNYSEIVVVAVKAGT